MFNSHYLKQTYRLSSAGLADKEGEAPVIKTSPSILSGRRDTHKVTSEMVIGSFYERYTSPTVTRPKGPLYADVEGNLPCF